MDRRGGRTYVYILEGFSSSYSSCGDSSIWWKVERATLFCGWETHFIVHSCGRNVFSRRLACVKKTNWKRFLLRVLCLTCSILCLSKVRVHRCPEKCNGASAFNGRVLSWYFEFFLRCCVFKMRSECFRPRTCNATSARPKSSHHKSEPVSFLLGGQ